MERFTPLHRRNIQHLRSCANAHRRKKMRYLLTLHAGNSSVFIIVENPRFQKKGVVKATQVGKLEGFDEKSHELVFTACEPIEFIAGGGPWTMTEYKGTL